MAKKGGQRLIVEIGSQEKGHAPAGGRREDSGLTVGVLSGLSGKSAAPAPPVGERRFFEIDVDCFDARLRELRPRVAFQLPDEFRGEGALDVDIEFAAMDDFRPASIVRKVDALNRLLTARSQIE